MTLKLDAAASFAGVAALFFVASGFASRFALGVSSAVTTAAVNIRREVVTKTARVVFIFRYKTATADRKCQRINTESYPLCVATPQRLLRLPSAKAVSCESCGVAWATPPLDK